MKIRLENPASVHLNLFQKIFLGHHTQEMDRHRVILLVTIIKKPKLVMKLMTRTLVIMMVVAIAGLASCTKDAPEGEWSKMKWKAPNGLVKENSTYIIPAEGGEYTFECTNYSRVWLSAIHDRGKIVYPVYPQLDDDDFLTFTGEWFGVNCDRNHVIISFEPLEQDIDSRDLSVGVTAGDIFDSLSFTQRR